MAFERKIGDTILSVQGICLSFGGVTALDDVSFEVKQGEIRAIIGPNGAGKSSMLNCINGFYNPRDGQITFKGQTRHNMKTHEAAKQGIARTFQNIALFDGMATLDNIMTGRNLKMKRNLFWQALYFGPARKEEMQNREVVENMIDFLEIEAIRKVRVGQLPYGLQKRVELARALVSEPDLLLLDEPMAGMGAEESQTMISLLNELKSDYTMLLIEHDMDAVFALADQITVLVYGRDIASGVPSDIRANEEVRAAYLGHHEEIT